LVEEIALTFHAVGTWSEKGMHKNKSDKKNSRTLKRKVNKLRGAKFNVRKE
jgi:hypothetical protein